LSEAVEQFTGQRAHMTNEIRLLAGTRLVGRAVTMRLVRDEKASATEAGLTAIKPLESSPAGSVVVDLKEGSLFTFENARAGGSKFCSQSHD
jgi:regulator of RNase E activity RraA